MPGTGNNMDRARDPGRDGDHRVPAAPAGTPVGMRLRRTAGVGKRLEFPQFPTFGRSLQLYARASWADFLRAVGDLSPAAVPLPEAGTGGSDRSGLGDRREYRIC